MNHVLNFSSLPNNADSYPLGFPRKEKKYDDSSKLGLFAKILTISVCGLVINIP